MILFTNHEVKSNNNKSDIRKAYRVGTIVKLNQMKKIKKGKILEFSKLNKLMGGQEVKTQGSKITDKETGCVSQITDTYNDTNNNGRLDCGESHTETMTITCPQ